MKGKRKGKRKKQMLRQKAEKAEADKKMPGETQYMTKRTRNRNFQTKSRYFGGRRTGPKLARTSAEFASGEQFRQPSLSPPPVPSPLHLTDTLISAAGSIKVWGKWRKCIKKSLRKGFREAFLGLSAGAAGRRRPNTPAVT